MESESTPWGLPSRLLRTSKTVTDPIHGEIRITNLERLMGRRAHPRLFGYLGRSAAMVATIVESWGMIVNGIDRYQLSRLAYSVWAGDYELYRDNVEVAHKVLIALHGRCESTWHGERCDAFRGHPSAKHRHHDSDGSGLYWEDIRPAPVTYNWRPGDALNAMGFADDKERDDVSA